MSEWGLVWLLGALIPDVSVGELKGYSSQHRLCVCLLGSARGTVDNTYAHIPSYLNFHLFCFILLVFKTNSHHATQNWLQICWVARVHPKLSNPLLHLPKLWGCKHGTMYLSFFLPILRECLVSIFYLIYLLASSWGVYCLDLGEGCVIFICQVYNCGS